MRRPPPEVADPQTAPSKSSGDLGQQRGVVSSFGTTEDIWIVPEELILNVMQWVQVRNHHVNSHFRQLKTCRLHAVANNAEEEAEVVFEKLT